MHHVEILVEEESIGALATPFTIGRDPECDVILPDSSVSRRHVKVTSVSEGLFVEDMGSSNGTWLAGRRINREVVPTDQHVVIGRVGVKLRYVQGRLVPDYEPPTTTGDVASSRNATLEVEIPDSYFEPATNTPAVRTFDCPNCSKRLRCAADTTRVKCRNCESIITFDGATPILENSPAPVERKEKVRQQVKTEVPPPPPTPEPSIDQPLGVSGMVLPAEPPPTLYPLGEFEEVLSPFAFVRYLADTLGGKIALCVLGAGGIGTFITMLACLGGAKNLLALVIVGSALVLGAFCFVVGIWVIEALRMEGPSHLEERLQRLEKLRTAQLISDEEYDTQRQSILDSL